MRLDDVCNAVAGSDGLLFVSGVCLREVFSRAGCTLDAHIYIKRITTWGWADEDELESGALGGLVGSTGGEALRRDMREYHQAWTPHLKADYELHRVD